MMSLNTTIEETNERFSKCFKLKGALNYGCVTQKSHFKIIDGQDLSNTQLKNDNIAILTSKDLDTSDKLSEVFKHVNVVVTTDLDLKNTHDALKEAKNEEVLYFKSIILLENHEFQSLQELLENGPKFKVIDTKGLDEHDVMLKELETYCGFEKSKLEEIFKENEKESISKKVTLLVQACKEEKKEDEKDKKKEEKKEEEDDSKLDQLLTELESHSTLTGNISNLSEFANNNYNSQAQSTANKGDLFSKVYKINESDIIGSYRNTLAGFYKQLCRKTISSFFEQLSLEKLLGIILTNEENFDMFLKYVQIRGNEAVQFKIQSNNKVQYEEFLEMFKKILDISAQNKEYTKLIDIVIQKVLLEGTAKIIKQSAEKSVKEIKTAFTEESAAVKALNTHLVPEIVKHLITVAEDKVFEKETYIKLITVLLMIPITFREEKDFHQQVYLTVYKLILPYVQDTEKYNSIEVVNELLNHKFLKKMFDKLPTTIDYSYNNLTNEQKVLFEIFLLMRLLEESSPEANSSYNYPDCVLDLEKSKQILKEMKNFDLISYLVYFKNELTEEERNTKINIETLHNRFNHKFTSKHDYSGFKKMSIELDGESKLDGDGQICFSKDPEGEIVIKTMGKQDIDSNTRTFSINADSFYIHYPYNPHRVKCWGYGYNYKLGNNECYNTTTNPIFMQNLNMPIKMLKQSNTYTIALTEDNKLWRCGYNSQWSRSIYCMEEYDGELPPEKIIDLRAGTNNYAVLTEDHKIYIQGYCNGYHLEDGNQKSKLWHKERPNELEEKVSAWDVGYDYHVYVTDTGK
jgi:hypothetical protein